MFDPAFAIRQLIATRKAGEIDGKEYERLLVEQTALIEVLEENGDVDAASEARKAWAAAIVLLPIDSPGDLIATSHAELREIVNRVPRGHNANWDELHDYLDEWEGKR